MNEIKKAMIIDLIDDGILSEALELHEKIATTANPEVASAKVIQPKKSRISKILRYCSILAASFIVVFAFLPGLVRVLLPANGDGATPDGSHGSGGDFWGDFWNGLAGNNSNGGQDASVDTTLGANETYDEVGTYPDANEPEDTSPSFEPTPDTNWGEGDIETGDPEKADTTEETTEETAEETTGSADTGDGAITTDGITLDE